MNDSETVPLTLLDELDSLGEAHLVAAVLDEAGISYRVAEHATHGFGPAIPHGFAMLYVEIERLDEARALLESVREDEEILEEEEEDAEAPEDSDAAAGAAPDQGDVQGDAI